MKTEAEFATEMGRVSRGENRRSETNLRGEEILDHREEQRDGGGLRGVRVQRVPHRRKFRAEELHGGGGGDEAEGGGDTS